MFDVIVVGAGLSGLSAARELVREGLDVVVLEARDRPGGRTDVIEVDGVTVDLGGEWVDEAHGDLRALISDLGLELVPAKTNKASGRWYVSGRMTDGIPLSERDARVYALMEEALVETASGRDPETHWQDAPDDDLSVRDWLRREGMSDAGIHTADTLLASCSSTVPLDRMSFYSYANKIASRGGPGKGNEFRVVGGAGSVARHVASELGDRIRYSSPVVGVKNGDDGPSVVCLPEGGTSEELRARKVILALPFTCYRDIRFDPTPPTEFGRMFTGATYGVVRKTHFIFDEKLNEIPFTITDTHLGYCSASQTSGDVSGIVCFAGGDPLRPELGRSEPERKRRAVEMLQSLYDVPEPRQVIEKVWPHDYWTRGSYMIVAPGDLASFGAAMGSSFGDVYLAGAEGISVAPSFMNSAVLSGQRAAYRVAEELSPAGSRTA